MWSFFNRKKELPGRTLEARMADGFWYWSSILEGAMSFYREVEEAEMPTPQIRPIIETVLEQVAPFGGRALSCVDGDSFLVHLERVFKPWDKVFYEDWCEQRGDDYRFRHRWDRKNLVRHLWQYLKESDSFYLFLTERISNDPQSMAIEKMREYLVSEDLMSEEAFCYGQLLMVLGSVVCASQIDFVKARLDESGDLARMLQNTLGEYRSVDQVSEKTYEIYRKHFVEETGEELGANAYKVLLAKFVLDGEDHIYQVYDEAIRVDRQKVWDEADEVGEYREWVIKTVAEAYAGYDFAHPQAYRFYTRAMERPLASVLSFHSICLMFEQAGEWEDELAEAVHQAKMAVEKARYVAGDFSAEHLFMQGEMAFGHIHSGAEFEQYLKHIFTRLGYESELTKASGDQGADLILKKNGLTYVVQAKYYEKPVGNKAVQEAVAALKFYGANRAVVVTNQRYTKSAESLAKRNQVILQDGAALEELVRLAYSERALGHMF
ncbi:MAG: restriction endonuclease [Lachnospiraceae bacterium]|nr:restriction endonuclease [Lachnospiraceae bacterium]